MSDMIDGYNTMIRVGNVDHSVYTSVSLTVPKTCYMEAEDIEKLIEILQDRLKEIKDGNTTQVPRKYHASKGTVL